MWLVEKLMFELEEEFVSWEESGDKWVWLVEKLMFGLEEEFV